MLSFDPIRLLFLKARARYLTGYSFTTSELSQADSNFFVDGVSVFPKQIFLVVEHLDGVLDELLDGLVGTALDVFPDQLFEFRFEANGHRNRPHFMIAKNRHLLTRPLRET